MNRIISLFLFIFIASCLNGQYNSPIKNKVTLGKQTTADGLVWRGRTSDTVNLLTNKLDTSVYIVLDTATRAMWYYRASTTPKWTRLVDSLNNLQGTLSVEKGGTGSSSFASGNIPFSNGTLLTSDTSLYWNNTNKYLGIGTTNPISNFHISDGNSINSNLVTTDKLILTYQNIAPGLAGIVAGSAVGNRFVFKGTRSRGTLNSPIVPLENDDVLSFLGAIYDGGNTEGTAQISFVVDGTVGIDTAPQRIGFFTSQFRGVNRLERLTIKSTGNVGIGTTSPLAKLQVNGSSSASEFALKINDVSNINLLSVQNNGDVTLKNPLSVANGGTGSATQNFVDLTTNQSIGGAKTFTSAGTFNEVLIGKNTLTLGNGTTAANSSFSLLGVPNVSYTWSILNNSSGLSFSPSSPVLTLNGDTGAATFNSSVTATTGIFTNYAGGGTTPADIDNNGQIVRTSSIELKKDITNIKYGLNEILQIKPINFNWKNEDKFGNENENGFIAEDVINIIPNVVGSDANGIFMSYNKLIPILTKAIQEQNLLIKALEQRILTLENK